MAQVNQQHLIFLKKSIEISKYGMDQGHGGPFGAVIVKDNKIIAEGYNQVTSTNDPTAHAEVVAIRKACSKLKQFSLAGTIIYTSCEPCPMCLASIYWARIDKVFFSNTRESAKDIGFDDSFIYNEIGKPLENRSIPMVHFHMEQAVAVFKEWTQKNNKIEY